MLTIKDIIDSYIKRFDSKRKAVEELSMQMDIDEKTIEYWTSGKTKTPSRKNMDALRQVLEDAGLKEEADALLHLEKRELGTFWDDNPSQAVQNHRQAFPESVLNREDLLRYKMNFPKKHMFEFMLLTAAYGDSALAAYDLHKAQDPARLCKDFSSLRKHLGMNKYAPDSIYNFWEPVLPYFDHIPEDPYDIPDSAMPHVVESVINAYRGPDEIICYENGLYKKLTVKGIYAMISNIEEIENEADEKGYVTIAEYTITNVDDEQRIIRLTSDAWPFTQKLLMLYLYARHRRCRNACSGRFSPSALECFTKLFDIQEEEIPDDSTRSKVSEQLKKYSLLPNDSTKSNIAIKIKINDEAREFEEWYERIIACDYGFPFYRPIFYRDETEALPYGKDFYSIKEVKDTRKALDEIQLRIKRSISSILLIGMTTFGMALFLASMTRINPSLPQFFILADTVTRIAVVVSVLIILFLFIKLLFSDRASNGLSKKCAEYRMQSLYLEYNHGLICDTIRLLQEANKRQQI